MRLGISSYTFGWAVGVRGQPAPPPPLTVDGLLSKATELGVGVVQIADNLPLDGLANDELVALRQRADELHVELEVGTAGIGPAHLHRYLDIARQLRSKVLRVVIDTADQRPTAAEVVDTLKPLAADFEQANVLLAIENHDRFPAGTIAQMLQQLGSSHFGVCLDTANSIGCLESLETVLASLGSFVVNLHLKDYAITRLPHRFGFAIEGRATGQGDLNVPWLLAELRRRGRDCNAILELWTPPQEVLADTIALEDAWARQSVAYLRQFIAE